MRILYLSHLVPVPDGTGDLRHYQFLRGLASRHNVRILVGAHQAHWNGDDINRLRAYAEDVEVLDLSQPRIPRPARMANRLARSVLPRVSPWWLDREFISAVERTVEVFRPDVIHANVPTARLCWRTSSVPMVVDFCDAMSLQARAFGGPLRAWWWKRGHQELEAQIASFVDRIVVISERDAATMNCPRTKVLVVPNGVDLDYYRPVAEPYDDRMLSFVGAMDYVPNIDAVGYLAREIWPLIRHALPDARLYLVGRNPAPSIRRLDGREGIYVTGTVDDIRAYARRSTATIAPLRHASGLQNKVIQSLAMGVPAVVTPAANGGIGACEDDGVITAPNPLALAEVVIRLMCDSDRRDSLGRAGRDYVERNFTWGRAIGMLEDAYRQAIEGRSRP